MQTTSQVQPSSSAALQALIQEFAAVGQKQQKIRAERPKSAVQAHAEAVLLQALDKVPATCPAIPAPAQQKLWAKAPTNDKLRQAGYHLAAQKAAKGAPLTAAQGCLLGALTTLRQYEHHEATLFDIHQETALVDQVLSEPVGADMTPALTKEKSILASLEPGQDEELQALADDLQRKTTRVAKELGLSSEV